MTVRNYLLCLFTFKQIIKYYINRGSPVYVCFIDASKAFDRVNHFKLFNKFIDRKVPLYVIKILCNWYGSQIFCVRWGAAISESFYIGSGVRQGGILSPYLFNVYLDDLSVRLNSAATGCNFKMICFIIILLMQMI